AKCFPGPASVNTFLCRPSRGSLLIPTLSQRLRAGLPYAAPPGAGFSHTIDLRGFPVTASAEVLARGAIGILPTTTRNVPLARQASTPFLCHPYGARFSFLRFPSAYALGYLMPRLPALVSRACQTVVARGCIFGAA